MERPAVLIAYRALSDIAGKGAFFLVTVAAARRLTGEAFGVFALGSTIGWILAVTADFGIQLHLARTIAQRRDSPERLLRRWLRVRLWTAAATYVAGAGLLSATGLAGPYTLALWLLTLVYGLNGIVEFLHYFYRGLSRSDIESTLTLCQRGGTLAAALAALWWRPDVTVLAVALSVPAVATLAYSAWLAARMAAAAGSPPSAVASTTAEEFLRAVAPIGMGIVLSALYFRIDVFLIEWWKGTAAVGLYSAVFRLVEALRLFPAAALAVTLPMLCRATNARPLLNLSAAVTGFALVATAILWLAAGRLVPLIYGDAYAVAVPAFQILMLSFPLMSLNYVLTHQLIGWNGHRAYALLGAAALVVNVVINTRLIPALSIVGAAWSTLLTEVVLTTGCLTVLWLGDLRAASAPVAIRVEP